MILSSLGNFKDLGLLVMRVGLGVMFINHGAPKMFGGPEGWRGVGGAMGNLGVTFAPEMWGFLAALAEFGGGICLVLGLAMRPACLMMAFTMLVAAIHHLKAGDGIDGASHAIESGVAFVGLLVLGPGKYSVDRK